MPQSARNAASGLASRVAQRVHRGAMRLITIRFSHYNERARWALDRLGVAYEEEPYMPLFHVLAVARATRGRGGSADHHSTRYSTPVLITDSGRVLTASTPRAAAPRSKRSSGTSSTASGHTRGASPITSPSATPRSPPRSPRAT
jgi:hypothetical protein